jgi:Bacteriophage T4-like portal protein (Gp20)
MEDFWLPRREGGKGTEITTLPGGQNLGELEDVKYFEKKLYKALNVPVSRLNPENTGFTLGRTSEITRDELKFAKFVDRLRNKFADMFDQALRVQCVLKGICTADEWNEFKEHIYYDFIKDNNFTELKEAELMKERLSLLAAVDPYTGRYYSQAWIQRNVLRMNDDNIKEMQAEIDEEKAMGLGLPVSVTNDVAQQMMMSGVPQQPEASNGQEPVEEE